MVVQLSSGRIVSVSRSNAGDELEGAHASGVSQLLLKDAGEFFDAPGGSLLIDGDTLAYTGIGGADDDSITVVFLAAPTTTAYADGERVEVLPLTPTVTAQVVREGEGESEPAVLWHVIEPFLPLGIRDPDDQEWCLLMSDREGDGWMVVNVRGKTTQLNPGAIGYPTVTNRCTDPPPANYLNWVGGVGGGTGPSGYSVANSSTYSSQGLHAKITHGAGGWGGKIAPNGDGFTVDPYDPGGFGNSLGTAVRTYKITEDMQFSFSYYTTTSGGVVALALYLYEADGTEITHSVSGAPYLSNWDETIVPLTLSRFVTNINYSELLAAYPTLDSVLIHAELGSGFSAGEFTWVGSCMVVNSGGLSSGSVVPYSPTTGVVYPNPPVSWDEILNRPTVFPPDIPAGSLLPAGGASGEVLTKDSGTDYDTSWQPAGGGGGAVTSVNTQTGAVVLDQDDIADGTTAKQFTATEQAKLAGIATGATLNSSDAALLARANHTGTQLAATISDLAAVVKAYTIDEFADAVADVAMGTHKITALQDGTATTDAVNKGQMDTAIAAGAGGVQVDTYTTVQSATAWAKPAGAVKVEVEVVASGGGGGSGRKGITTVARTGGGAGGRGGRHIAVYNAADLPANLYVWIGAAGAGGAAQTVNSTNGSVGTIGTDCFVSTSSSAVSATAKLLSVAAARGGGAGNGGTTANVTGGSGGYGEGGDSPTGGVGGGSTTTGGATGVSGGGGGGGVITAANSELTAGDAHAGTVAGASNTTGWRVDAPTIPGTVGNAGSTAAAMGHGPVPGVGGSGGAASKTGNAGAGGAGIYGGGGGGGGAAVDAVGNSGAGGAGGVGYVKITTYF